MPAFLVILKNTSDHTEQNLKLDDNLLDSVKKSAPEIGTVLVINIFCVNFGKLARIGNGEHHIGNMRRLILIENTDIAVGKLGQTGVSKEAVVDVIGGNPVDTVVFAD